MKSLKKVGVLLLALMMIVTTYGMTTTRAAGQLVVNNSIKTYMTAADAKNRVNSVGEYQAGTYNIYKEYDGMLNISKSTSAGAWINPADNGPALVVNETDFTKAFRAKYDKINVRTSISGPSTVIGVVNKGMAFEGELVGSWLKINYNGKIAYTWAGFYYEITELVTRYAIGGLNIRDEATSLSTKLGYLTKDDKVEGSHMGNGWFRFIYNNKSAYVYDKYITSTAPVSKVATAPVEEKKENTPKIANTSYSSIGAKVASIAKSKVGSRYVFASAGPYAFDCSGLVYYAYKQVGVTLPRRATLQYSYGRRVSFDDMKPGDLIFFGNSSSYLYHVGIYVGNRMYVHASTPSTGVIMQSVDSRWVRNNYYGVKRIAD